MTEPSPNSTRHGNEVEAPAPRRRFVLARLATAVRRQDWFTVLVEIAIVVLGVVIGLQVNDWGQRRADRVKEQAYLRQLASDLRETERDVAEGDSIAAQVSHEAITKLLRAWGRPERAPRDSVLAWHRLATRYSITVPVVGTAEALVATGDISLIRDDSLRTAITAYLRGSQGLAEWTYTTGKRLIELQDERPYDYMEALVIVLSDSTRAAHSASRPIAGMMPTGTWAPPFPLDVDRYFASEAAYRYLYMQASGVEALSSARRAMAASASDLLRRVETQLEP